MSKIINTVLICIEAFLIGQFVVLLVIGADYGLNSKLLNTTSREGFYPFYLNHWPQHFYLMDQEGEVLGANWSCSPSSEPIKEIVSYSFCSDTLYVKCLDNDNNTIVLRPEKGHGHGLSCFFEQVPRYPNNAVEVQISGNKGLFSRIKHMKIVTLLVFIPLIFCHILVSFFYRRNRKRANSVRT